MELNQESINLALLALLACSEFLSLFPAVKANGIFQLVWQILKKLAPSK